IFASAGEEVVERGGEHVVICGAQICGARGDELDLVAPKVSTHRRAGDPQVIDTPVCVHHRVPQRLTAGKGHDAPLMPDARGRWSRRQSAWQYRAASRFRAVTP